MDQLEEKLRSIESFNKKVVQEYKQLVAKTVYDTANKYNEPASSLDQSFRKVFPETLDLGEFDDKPFNPICTVEFKDKKSTQVIDDWNTDKGILPNRKVMGNYYIDIEFNSDYIKCITDGCSYQYTNNTVCGGNLHGNNPIHILDKLLSTDYNRGHTPTNKYNMIITSHTFEVDNYLNLYHKNSGLYLMFNKIPFPQLPFYLNKHISYLGKGTYPIYITKKVKTMPFNFTNYKSVDNRENLLKTINELVPEDYDKVYDFYDRFRRLGQFEIKSNKSELSIDDLNEDVDIISDDGVDTISNQIIKELENKLRYAMNRAQLAEKAVSDMVEDYNVKSVEVLTLTRKLNDMEKEIKIKTIEMENTIKETQLTEKQEYQNEIMKLKESLVNAQSFKAKSEANGITVDELKRQQKDLSYEITRLKGLNDGLVKQLRHEKDNCTSVRNDNEQLMANIRDSNEELNRIMILNEELNKNNIELENKFQKLSSNLEKIGKSSDNALEQVLTDKVDEQTEYINTLKEENQKLKSDNKTLNTKLMQMKNTLSKLC